MSINEVIEGAIFDCISDWKSGYKINEDLPYIAEWITEFIMKALEDFNYIIMKKDLVEALIK